MVGNIKDKCRLTHGRSSSHQYKLRSMETGEHIVQIYESRRDTCYSCVLSGSLLYLLDNVHDDPVDPHKFAGAVPLLYQIEHTALGLFKKLFNSLRIQITVLLHFLAQLYHLPEYGFVRHDLCVMLGIHRCRNRLQYLRYGFCAYDLIRYIVLLKLVLQGYQIDRLTLLEQLYHILEQYSVLTVVEILLGQHIGRLHYGVSVHEHGTNNRLLGIQIVGKLFSCKCIFHVLSILLMLPRPLQQALPEPQGEA